MSEQLYDSISRLSAWIREFGQQKNPVFIADVVNVIEAAKRNHDLITSPADHIDRDTQIPPDIA